jgi:uncharacterized protein (DUF427 family)
MNAMASGGSIGEETSMPKSPGHRKWPEHKVEESPLGQRMKVELDGALIADSSDVIRVDEDGQPARYYFPRSDVKMDKLERSVTTSKCPFKGTAHYFSLNAGGKKFADAVWTYEDPYEEHRGLKDRLAFYDDKVREIHLEPRA